MEKTTKKKKSKRAQKRRIGLIAVGGLSLVLTVCLSVGATLAWFAGSTWASNDLYMGGPVYVEMAGRNAVTSSDGSITGETGSWIGGEGKLDIVASARTTGTAKGDNGWDNYSNILLPGQKLLIYSQARVFSTLKYDDRNNNNYWNESSGANTTNSSGNANTYTDGTGRVRSATTSVLRAKFSINVTFDPSVGFNNFTDKAYADAYPVQSAAYNGDGNAEDKTWYGALTDTPFATVQNVARKAYRNDTNAELAGEVVSNGSGGYKHAKDADNDGKIETSEDATIAPKVEDKDTEVAYTIKEVGGYTTTYTGRRDAVKAGTKWVSGDLVGEYLNAATNGKVISKNQLDVDEAILKEIKAGTKTSIFKWSFVSENVYANAKPGQRMGAPFDGTVNSAGGVSNRTYTENKATGKLTYKDNTTAGATGNGFYGLWTATVAGEGTEAAPWTYTYEEADAFYKARTEAYLQSYVEHYRDPYNQNLVLQIGSQIHDLEDALNNAFKGLVTESSDRILAGYTSGFTGDDDGAVKYGGTAASSLYGDDGETFKTDLEATLTASKTKATWLYVDPTIDNDINATDATTGTGGWWYLVESDTASVASGKNAITTEIDQVLHGGADTVTAPTGSETDNKITAVDGADVSYIANQTDVDKKRAQYVGQVIYNWGNMKSDSKNELQTTVKAFTRSGTADNGTSVAKNDSNQDIPAYGYTNRKILQAKLFEVKPDLVKETMGQGAEKVVSVSFPFVNGNFELPGKEMTNIFANARISFKISFQALQAFFPYAPSVDGLPKGSALAGTAKALNIENSIPIFNEAFNYLSYISN